MKKKLLDRHGRPRARRPLPKIRPLPMRNLAPNILTILALCAGLTAINFGLGGDFKSAVIAITIAGILDGLDGRGDR